jgi:hypothetical protein
MNHNRQGDGYDYEHQISWVDVLVRNDSAHDIRLEAHERHEIIPV